MDVRVISENAVQVSFGSDIDESLIPVIAKSMDIISDELGSVLTDLIPSYTTLLCFYDYNRVDSRWMVRTLTRLLATVESDEIVGTGGRQVDIPVWYDPSVGYDLQTLASEKNMTVEELIELHTGREYQVFAIGFNPGFAFLGRLHERIVAPRRSTPRKKVSRGSVGIADAQTAVYPLTSPGGWNIIGRSPQEMFDATNSLGQASLLKVGDRVRFVPINRGEYITLGGHLDD